MKVSEVRVDLHLKETWQEAYLWQVWWLLKDIGLVWGVGEHILDSKVHGAYMGPTWGRQEPGGSHVGPMNLAMSAGIQSLQQTIYNIEYRALTSFYNQYWNQLRVQLWTHQPVCELEPSHYSDVLMGAIASQITSLTIVYSTVYSDVDQIKHQSSASLAFVTGEFPHKWPVTRKLFPFDDVIMAYLHNIIIETFKFLSSLALNWPFYNHCGYSKS